MTGPDILSPVYHTDGFYDEMFEQDGRPCASVELLVRRLQALSEGELQRRQKAADLALLNMGITFNVYGHEAGTEKIWPFDMIPRIIEDRRMELYRARTQAAHHRAEPVHRRPLPRSEDRQETASFPSSWRRRASAS